MIGRITPRTRPRRLVRWIAEGVLAVAIVAVALVLPAATAEADGGHLVLRSSSPVLNLRNVAPGTSATGSVSLDNDSPELADLYLKAVDLTSDDNGCTPAEARVDSSCGDGEGELAEQMVITVSGDQGSGYEQLWKGSLVQLADGTELTEGVPARGTVDLRVNARLPFESGNETQSDGLTFSLRWTLVADHSEKTATVLGTSFERPGGTTGGNGPIGHVAHVLAESLARTGAPLAGLAIGGLGALVAGAFVLRLSRRHALPED